MTTLTAPAVETRRPGTGPSAARLTGVELRKLADTRAGRWLLITIGLVAAGIVTVQVFVLKDAEQTFTAFFTPSLFPVGLLLPVLGILSVTGEWSQRTALTTFALVPRRHRVVAAKLAAVVLAALASVLVSLAVAAVGTLAARATGGAGTWTFDWHLLPYAAVFQVANVLMGVGFGLLLLNTPLAIVTYLLLPTVWSILSAMIEALHGPARWLDTSITMQPLLGADVTAGQWGRLAVSLLVWLVLPLVAGLVRTLRREVS
ncbi:MULTISPECIES: ABC transporter permease [Micromonospora]|uniref:ABC transporter permease n=1 Tax=Micromonospora solifontis TaxID=2487138 RepID=A0ABX9WH33_9ACTN|nr:MULTISPECIES: ABC transporter permease [Micromonospora]NES15177.1 ABC transporter permease [Micromonospora sp. PPF5-17B]NES36816.1 ABC transporter permease [Micromonospora solifontis]NES56512.1 ABC transporter permease [Micromonospora sp. PPF5-6]RNL99009.1 ABC transporter permease [Micromonospora solifontis]